MSGWRSLLNASIPLLLFAALIVGAWLFWPDAVAPPAERINPMAFAAALDTEAEGFAQVDPDWDFVFPRDQGPHLDQRTEVWDLSGQVVDPDGLRYGLRLTFVRIGLVPPAKTRASTLAANAVLFARFAFVPQDDDAAKTSQRASRAAAGLAGADREPWRVWLEDWSLEQGTNDELLLRAGLDDLELTLVLTPQKAVITEVEIGAGLFDSATNSATNSVIGDGGSGFHFFVQPRLSAVGTLRLGQGPKTEAATHAQSVRGTDNGNGATSADSDIERRTVTGSAWLERAWGALPSTFVGGRGQLAMNRFLLQLDADTELMCLHLRRQAGGGTPVPNCLAIFADGSTRLYQRRELTLEPAAGDWTQAADGTLYPLHWRLALPALGLDIEVQPLQKEQSITSGLGAPSWSGAVTLSGRRGGDVVAGSGRMDLNGYAANTKI